MEDKEPKPEVLFGEIQSGVEEIRADAVDFLRGVYLNEDLPLPLRMRAAEVAAPFERPKLMAVANIGREDFAERLQKARVRAGTAPTSPRVAPPRANPDAPKLLTLLPIITTSDKRFKG